MTANITVHTKYRWVLNKIHTKRKKSMIVIQLANLDEQVVNMPNCTLVSASWSYNINIMLIQPAHDTIQVVIMCRLHVQISLVILFMVHGPFYYQLSYIRLIHCLHRWRIAVYIQSRTLLKDDAMEIWRFMTKTNFRRLCSFSNDGTWQATRY